MHTNIQEKKETYGMEFKPNPSIAYSKTPPNLLPSGLQKVGNKSEKATTDQKTWLILTAQSLRVCYLEGLVWMWVSTPNT